MTSHPQDDYAFWRAGLAGLTAAVQDGNPQPGFYRCRSVRGGPWLPVAIWRDEAGILQALRGVDPVEAVNDVWLACARFPVPEEDYRHAYKHGSWPGALPEADGPRDALEQLVGRIGDNRPPEPGADVIAAIDETVAEAKAWLDGRQIVSQADADRVEAFVAALSKAQKDAEGAHRSEKAPHLEAGRKVDARWKPVIDSAQGAVRMLKAALTPFLRAREAEKKAEAAKAIAAGAMAVRADLAARTSGTHGRKVSLRQVRRAVIRDYPAALQFFAEHPEVRELVQRLASKVAGVGGTVPGVDVVVEQEAA